MILLIAKVLLQHATNSRMRAAPAYRRGSSVSRLVLELRGFSDQLSYRRDMVFESTGRRWRFLSALLSKSTRPLLLGSPRF